MRRLLPLLLAIITLFCIFPASAASTAAKPIEVYYLGEKLDFPVPPQLVKGSTMVPMRAIFEALGYTVLWDSSNQQITATNIDYDRILLTISSKTALVNEKKYTLDTPPVLIQSSTMVPLRFIGEASGYLVTWKSANGSSRVDIEYGEGMLSKIAELKQTYIDDLQLVKTELPQLHANLFFHKSKEAFDAEIDALIKAVPNLRDYQIKFELMKIINSLADTHTNTYYRTKTRLNLRFFMYDDGVYLADAPERFSDFIGQKLTAIQGTPIDTVWNKLLPILPIENDMFNKYVFCDRINCTDYLRAVNIIQNEQDTVTYTFGNKSFSSSSEFINDSLASQSEKTKVKYPLSFRNVDKNYWYTAIDDKKAIYIKYNKCVNMSAYPFADMIKDAFAELDKKGYTKLVVDMRDNLGGNSTVYYPLLNEIKKHQAVNLKNHLYVITGRSTFSSGLLNTIQLVNETNATLVGEATGGSPNHYGNVKSLRLGNLDMYLDYSTAYYETMSTNAKSLVPEIKVIPKAESFLTGKDDFLEAVYADMAK